MLDLCNLKENYHLLIEYMKEGDYKYSDGYIRSIKLEITLLLNSDIIFESYEDYYLYRIKNINPSNTRRFSVKSHITLIMNFDLYGIYPNGRYMKYQLFENENRFNFSEEFQYVLDSYNEMVDYNQKNEKTRYVQFLNLKNFLIFMQENNMFTLSDINEKNVVSYFLNDDNQIIRGYGCRYCLRSALITIAPRFEECNRILHLIPHLKEHRKNIQYLTDDEIFVLKDVVINGHENISFKDRAILALFIYTAMRSVDVSNIMLQDIDWDNEVIHVNQSKTGKPYDIPVIPIVGNQLSNYLIYERPNQLTDSPYLFVQDRFINRKMLSAGMGRCINRIMRIVGIRCNEGDRKGTHIFRHHLASAMIENEIPAPVASATLGHSYPGSLEDYVRTDFVHLKECALSIENFPFKGYTDGDNND